MANNNDLYSFTNTITSTGSLFIAEGLKLKDGRESPYFLNMGIFNSGKLLTELGQYYANYIKDNGLYTECDCLVGPAYKGIPIAISAAMSLYNNYQIDMPIDFDRIIPKTHGEGSGKHNYFVTSAIEKAKYLIMLDDVASTMQTKRDLIEKIENTLDKDKLPTVKHIIIATDRQLPLPETNTKDGITSITIFEKECGIKVHSLFKISDIFKLIYKEEIPVWQYNDSNRKDGNFEPLSDYWREKINKFHEEYGIR